MTLRRVLSLLLSGSALIGLLALPATVSADPVYVRVRPPRVRVEVRGPRPSRRHVWVGGYNRWDGNAYIWAPGRWEIGPRVHAVWVPGHWVRTRRGWYWVDGRWR